MKSVRFAALFCVLCFFSSGCGAIAGLSVEVLVSPEAQAMVLAEEEVAEVLLWFGFVDEDSFEEEEQIYLRRIGVLCDVSEEDAIFTKYHQWTGPPSAERITIFLLPSDRVSLECGDWGGAAFFEASPSFVEGALRGEATVTEDDYDETNQARTTVHINI